MSLQVVVGQGPVGRRVAARLAAAGHEVRVLSRTGGTSTDAVEHRSVDASDAPALVAATRGAAVVYNCANPAYTRWAQDWPPIAQALLRAAEGAVLVTMSNLYGYGEVDGPLTEDTPLRSRGTKGRVRVAMWHEALARHHAGDLRATEARASDYVGPGVGDNGLLDSRVVPRLLRGRPVLSIGATDVPHSWTAVDDVADTLVTLGREERAWGRAWHVPSAPPVTFREAVDGLCRAAGVAPVPVRALPQALLRATGLVVPLVRELGETAHQRLRPFVLDSSAATRELGLTATPLEQTWAATVAPYLRAAGSRTAA